MNHRTAKKEIINGKLYLTGPLMIANQPNANGVVYTKEAIENALKNFGDKPLFGVYPKDKTSNQINLNEIVCSTNSIELKENILEARVEMHKSNFLSISFGKLLATSEMKVGFNTIVEATPNENNIVEGDIKLLGFSLVNPEDLV